MNDNKQKNIIVGDMHGSADRIQQTLKDIGFEPTKKPTISIGSPPEEVPQVNTINPADIIKNIRETIELREKANIAHHDAQYEKMYPKKLK